MAMTENQDGKLPPIEEKEDLTEVYKGRGFQKYDLKNYLQLKKQQKQRTQSQLPAALKIILSTPILIIFCIGLIFIPFMTYLFITSKEPPPVEEKYDPILQKIQ
jgi:hypothetical protein